MRASNTRTDKATGRGEIAVAKGQDSSTVMNVVHDNTLVVAAPPRAIYQPRNGAGTSFTAAIPILDAPSGFVNEQDVKVVSHPKAAGATLHPPRRVQGDLWHLSQIDAWLRERGAVKTDADWTRYFPNVGRVHWRSGDHAGAGVDDIHHPAAPLNARGGMV